MKKNFYLLGVLVALLVGTYYFQEIRMRKNFEESLTKNHLIAKKDIKSLSWKDVKAEKKQNQWWAQDILLSHNIFNQIEKKISSIKKLKSLEGDSVSYFTKPVEFKVNDEPWQIGDMTLDRQGFYLSKNNELMVAMIEAASGEITDDESKIQSIKLDDLKSAFSYQLEELVETQLFRYYPQLPLGRARVESQGRPPYELDFINNSTQPPPIKGIETHEKIFEKFNSTITQVTIKKAISYSEKLKSNKLGQIVFSKDNQTVTWELWLGPAKSADVFLIDSDRKLAWQVVGGTLKAFFIQVQDYWDKKVIPRSSFKNFTRLGVTFYQDSRSAQVEIINREPLVFESSRYKVNSEKMNKLFQYAFNLSENNQANRVSQLSSSEKKEILSGSHLRLEVMGQELLFWRKKEELIVVNLTQDFKAHFFLDDETFRANFEDVLR